MSRSVTAGLATLIFVLVPSSVPAQEPEPATRPGAAPQTEPSERDKIERLIDAIAALENATFVRNEKEHSAREAADHLRRKLRRAGDRITTARQFIERIASRSSTSGEVYRIRFSGGREVESGEFLLTELRKLEEGGTGGAAGNPTAPEGNRRDPRAIEIRDAVLDAMGGRKAWDDTRYISWRFFGRRLHVWDKWTGDIRVEFSGDDGKRVAVSANLHTKAGKAWKDGEPVTVDAELAGVIRSAISAWVNDSYWLVMPYKLADPGVALAYKGDAKLEDGRAADLLQLTFDGVGETPENRYDVYVARDTRLVEQWSYYRSATDAKPEFTCPWRNWQRYGAILLSDDRGILRDQPARHTEIAVFDSLPRSVFDTGAPFDPTAHTPNPSPR